jgi:hypothetical protein
MKKIEKSLKEKLMDTHFFLYSYCKTRYGEINQTQVPILVDLDWSSLSESQTSPFMWQIRGSINIIFTEDTEQLCFVLAKKAKNQREPTFVPKTNVTYSFREGKLNEYQFIESRHPHDESNNYMRLQVRLECKQNPCVLEITQAAVLLTMNSLQSLPMIPQGKQKLTIPW